MHRLIASLLLVAAMAGTAAADIDVTFETVDEVERSSWEEVTLLVRGIPQGQTQTQAITPRVFATDAPGRESLQSCERMALLAASRPGRYLLRIATARDVRGGEYLRSCRLLQRVQ